MRIGRRLFPYPTLNNSKIACCFNQSSYSLEYLDYTDRDSDSYTLKDAHIVLNNSNLANLLDVGKAKAVLLVESPSTIFRQLYQLTTNPTDVKIPISNLRGKVEISSYVYAVADINDYQDGDFLEEYEDYKFNIEKYDILAIDDGYTLKIDYEKEKDNKLSSIFLVICDSEEKSNVMKVENRDKQVVIYLPETQFGIYDRIKEDEYYQDIFFAIITIPALATCLINLQKSDVDLEDIIMNHNWFRSIVNGYKRVHNSELTSEIFKELNAFELAQELMNYATVRSIDDIFGIMSRYVLMGGEYDE